MTDDVYRSALAIVENAITQQPRSLQRAIGPSQMGSACDHCFAARLAGWEQRSEPAWIPFTGTATHAALEQVFSGREEWLTEKRLSVGDVAGEEVRGTADLFHIPSGTVIDFKTASASTLKFVKAKPKREHSIQASLYCLGYIRAGYDVKQWAIWYMPRSAISLRSGVWHSEPFDPLVALEALDRATQIVEKIQSFPSTEERDAWISALPRDPDCYDCGRFHDAPKAEPKDSLQAILGV